VNGGEPRSDGRRRALVGGRPSRFARTVAVSVALGAVGGLVTVGFVWVLERAQELIWTDLPGALAVDPTGPVFVISVVLAGAVALGLGRRWLGEYPISIEDAIEDHRRDGEFDHRHIGQAIVLSVISLGFGAALGPEAALVAILGGLGSWIARVIDANTAESTDVSFIGISAALGALFGTAGAAVLTLDPRRTDVDDARTGRLWRVIPGLAAAGAGLLIYRHLGSSANYFDLGLPEYTFSAVDLLWASLVAVLSAGAGVAFLAVGRTTDVLLAPLAGRPVLTSVVGGLGLGLLASWSPLVLFSGHEGVQTLVSSAGTESTLFLVLVAVAKLVAAALLLSAAWKGGRFFPVMFVGAAIGLAASQSTDDVGLVVALAAGMTAIVGVLLMRPAATAGFMILFFPVAAWPLEILAAVVGATVGRQVGARLAPPGADDEVPLGQRAVDEPASVEDLDGDGHR
jgi:H+/Cl- antiporter ClcA